MKYQPLARRAASVGVALVTCAASLAQAQSFEGTAYLKTRHTLANEGKGHGLGQAAAQVLVDQCNAFRRLHHGLPPVSPPDDTMRSADVFILERYIDVDKALTIRTGHVVNLPDMLRWLADYQSSAASGGIPSVPPDCAAVRSNETKSGTLWRDGIKYTLLFAERKATGVRAAPVKRPLLSAERDFLALPTQTHLGQTCHEVTTPAGPGGALAFAGKTCIWDRFPFVAYLNWPFALSGRIQVGPDRWLHETIEALAFERDHAIAPAVFQVPPGFSVSVHK
jgi:hypothetical protein